MKKQTDTERIMAYGRTGVELFDQIELKLKSLVDETAEVLYNGMRARDFKTTCTDNAVTFSESCTKNMGEMSEVIRSASSYISTNLGGQEITLEPPTVMINMPEIIVDESIETADSGVLNGLMSSCNSIYGEIDGLYQENLTAFTNLGVEDAWIGPEYDDALTQVTALTKSMQDGIEESRTIMETAIKNQLSDLGMS